MKKNLVSILTLLGFCLLLVVACKKTGVNENLDPNNQKPVDFMSTKKGSYWKYATRAGERFTRRPMERDTVVNGLTYSYYERTDDTTNTISPEFFGKNGVYHLTLVNMDVNGSGDNYLEYAFWRDSAKKGDSWSNVGTMHTDVVSNVQVLIESYQTDDHLTMTIGPHTYTDVVHVHSDAKATALNVKLGTFDIWFVKGLGVIRQEADINAAGFYKQQYTDSLVDYHIEK